MPQFAGGWELVLILLVVLVVFGAKRLPDSARALGRSMRILKAETKGLRDDDGARTGTTSTTASTVPPAVAPAPAPAPAPQPYAGQQLFDADGRPVQAPVNGSAPVQQPSSPQA